MYKSGCFIVSAVIFTKLLFKILYVVDRHRYDFVYTGSFDLLIVFRPQSAESLRGDGRSVIIGFFAAFYVLHHKKDRYLPVVFGIRKLSAEFIKSCQHHFDSGFYCKASSFKVNNSVQNFRLIGRKHFFQCAFVIFPDPVGCSDKLTLCQSCYVSSCIIMSSVQNPKFAGIVDKLVSVKMMSERRMIVLAFSYQIQSAVLSDSHISDTRYRGRGIIACF